MITSRLKNIFVLSVPVFIFHEVEEFLTGFWKIDPLTSFVAKFFPNKNLAIFTFFNVELLIFMIVIALAMKNERWQLRMFTLFGLIYFFELSHVIRFLYTFAYYPGMITALISLIVGFFFWKELIKNYKLIN